MTTVDIVVSIAAKLVEYLVIPIGRPFRYIVAYNNNINGLRNQIPNLRNAQFRIKQLVDAADRNGELVMPDVKEWLARADGIVEDAEKLLNHEGSGSQNCSSGSCLNLKSRHQISRKAKKKAMVIDKLVHDGKFNEISYPAPHPPLWSTSGRDLDVFESRKQIFKAIMESLEDDCVSIIGVYGMGGIGKTTLVEAVAKEAGEYNLFDEIVMVVISHAPNLRKIQSDFAEMLGLNLKEENYLLRAARLRERLNQLKSTLVILDDVWTPLDLQAIGIMQGNLQKGCKIILTSRSLDLCISMNAQRNFQMDVLSEEDSWNLFRNMTDDMVDLPDLHPTATKVAKRCAGLPIAIVTVARALKGKNKHAWRDALHQLKHSTPKHIKGMDANVYSSLELSFNYLEDEEAQSCFLLCSLFKNDRDISIEYLVRYGMGLRLFQNVHKIEEARDRAHTLIDNLKACCLLLDGDGRECFRIHDVTRDFVISMASRGDYMFLENGDAGYIEWPNGFRLNNCYALSVVSNDYVEFPNGLDCPRLQLLRLECCNNLTKFSDNFFQSMEWLKVVHMREVPIPSMPSSILSLKNILTLCIEQCKLGDLSLIGELKNLEILSFIGSDIEQLPRELGELAQLKLLDLTDCKNLKVIPYGVISKLYRLECLYMMNSFVHWGSEGEDGVSNATVAELTHLSYLRTLEIHIPDVKLFPKDTLFRNLVRFKIFIGRDMNELTSYSYSKTFRLRLDQDITLHGGMNALLKEAQHLIFDYPLLDYLEDFHNVVTDLKKENLGNLKCLEVYGYSGIEYLIDTSISSMLRKLKVVSLANLKEICHDHLPPSSFCQLRELRLSILPELTKLWKDPAGNASLGNLRTVFVSDCHELKHLFSQQAANDLYQLQKLHLTYCDKLEEVLSEDGGVAARMHELALPKLNSLKLESLPKLQAFCPDANINLATDGSFEASAPEPLFSTRVLFPTLEELSLGELDSVKEIWHRQLPDNNFRRLKVLTVLHCINLKIVFPSNFPQRLQNLETLYVHWCDSVEEICEIEDRALDNEKKGRLVVLPSIRDIQLANLPQLKNLWWNKDPDSHLSLQNLNSLYIHECDDLRYIFSISSVKGLVQLQELEVRLCRMMKAIFAEQREDDHIKTIVLPQLLSVELEDLPELSSFCERNHSLEFSLLEKIKITGCPKLNSFAASEGNREENLGTILQPLFSEKVALPNLTVLELYGMNSLAKIWHNKVPEKSYTKLRVLEVANCDQLLDIGPTNVLPWLQRLEVLHITGCDLLEEIFVPLGPIPEEDAAAATVSLPSLTELSLHNLPKLRNIWWDRDLHEIRRFQSLTSVEVLNCNSLNYIFSPSVAKGLVQLQKLKVDSCRSVKKIVGMNNDNMSVDLILLPRLNNLELENLPNLTSFCTRTSALKWISLRELRIMNCSKLSMFLSRMNAEDSEGTLNGSLFSSIQPFFNDKVEFPNLEKLRIDNLDNLKELWHEGIADKSFCQLRLLEVRNCENLLKVASFSLLPRLENLEELSIIHCTSLENIVKQGEDSGDKAIFPSLHTLQLINLPKLGSFFWGSSHLECPSLQNVTLEGCPSLQNFSSAHQVSSKLVQQRSLPLSKIIDIMDPNAIYWAVAFKELTETLDRNPDHIVSAPLPVLTTASITFTFDTRNRMDRRIAEEPRCSFY